MSTVRTRAWCMTINNYTDEDIACFHRPVLLRQVRYYIYGEEIGEEGTPHLQCTIIYHNPKKRHEVSKHFPRASVRTMDGTVEQSVAYCLKDETFVEHGDIPKQGQRTDIQKIKKMVKENKKIVDILDECTDYQQMRMVELLSKYQGPPPAEEKTVIWHYGDSGTGKTRLATESSDDYYISMGTLRWWDGYNGQDTVIIDDFRKDFCTFHELLRILDRYPYRVQLKGGSVWLRAKTIYITSCYSPVEVYQTREDINQLLRRINKIILFTKDNAPQEICPEEILQKEQTLQTSPLSKTSPSTSIQSSDEEDLSGFT